MACSPVVRLCFAVCMVALWVPAAVAQSDNLVVKLTYCIVDTGQDVFFSDRGFLQIPPKPGDPFFGQDACYNGPQPSYRDNGDGTITDLNTGLVWQKSLGPKMSFEEALAGASNCRIGGYNDWRLPTIKELYSLIDFRGNLGTDPPVAFIDTRYFEFRFGDPDLGERLIDGQFWSCTKYVGRIMNGQVGAFGVNFADGRIKCYPLRRRDGTPVRHFVRYVRGNPQYGKNRFVDNGDGTISDLATGLMWTKTDSGKPLTWQQALQWCEDLEVAGYTDWRLPNAKELHSIVDYTRAPDAVDPRQRGPAIDPVFEVTDPEAWYWSSTTLLHGRPLGSEAVYIAFGRATGWMPNPRTGRMQLLNVHGAGAQRSDPKAGDPNAFRWRFGRGPQGDVVRIYNYARAVRNITPDAPGKKQR